MSDQHLNWFWRRQGAQKIAEIAGQGIKLEASRLAANALPDSPVPLKSIIGHRYGTGQIWSVVKEGPKLTGSPIEAAPPISVHRVVEATPELRTTFGESSREGRCMKTVLVPRAAGFFIGMHVAWQLPAQGHSVFGVVNPNVP